MAASRRAGKSVWTWPLVRSAALNSFRKLDPRWMARNPVMFVVEVGSLLTTFWVFARLVPRRQRPVPAPDHRLALVHGALRQLRRGDGRGARQGAGRHPARHEEGHARAASAQRREETVSSSELRKGDIVLVREGEIVPGDGEVIEGVAYVNEAAITGESAPVLKEPGTDIRSGVTGGTQVVSDWLKIRITADPGETFLDRMIALVEGAQRQKTPNEIALTILLAGLSIIFLLVVVTLQPFAIYAGDAVSTVVLVALLVCLLPTTIGALLSAIGIAGMDRVTRFNVLAMSGRAVETAGDVDVLLLDKTGTITYGNRLAAEIIPVGGASAGRAVKAALWSSLGDDTPEGKSIVALARQMGAALPDGDGRRAAWRRGRAVHRGDAHERPAPERHVLDEGRRRRDRRQRPARRCPTTCAARPTASPARAARRSPSPRTAGSSAAIYLKDTVKPGMRERFDELRRMGIRPIMITGDNPLTAATIAQEAGVDDFVAEAKPEDKIRIIREQQAEGPPRRHDRRRHERRARAGPGRRRSGDELRHRGGQGSREHGGPRLQPDEAHRGRAHRQAAPHHPRRHHHVLRRQRRRQVLRHHPGRVRRHLPGAGQDQHHGPATPGERDPLGGHLQRAHHHRADPAGAARRRLPSRARVRAARPATC